MKKFLVILLTIAVVATCVAVFASCANKTYEIAVVTDVGQTTADSTKVLGKVLRLTLRLTTLPTSTINPLTVPTLPITTV